MLVSYLVCVFFAGVAYTGLVDWLRKGTDVWTDSAIEHRATIHGLWIVPIAGAVLLLLYYGARFVWWQISD